MDIIPLSSSTNEGYPYHFDFPDTNEGTVSIDRPLGRTIYLFFKILWKCLYCLFRQYEPKDFIQKSNDGSCYIDMGELYGTWVMGNAMDWWPLPVHIDQAKVDTFLGEIFTQLEKDGITEVNLSFAQICDINNLLDGTAGSATDTITPIFTDNYPVGDTGPNFLRYFNESANKAGIKVDLSFGGANANDADVKINGDPNQQATNLVQFMSENSISSVDFDLEGATVAAMGKDPNAIPFFTSLHRQLASQGKRSTITLAGSLADGPTGPL